MPKPHRIALAIFAAALFSVQQPAFANEECYDCFPVIASHADSVFCEANAVRDLVRNEFRGTSCYLKMRVTVIKIRGTAARVRRRANTIRVANWDKEFDRMDSLLFELGALIDTTYDRAALGQECPLNDCTPQLAASIDCMYAHIQAMRDVCHGYQTVPGSIYLDPALNAPAPATALPVPAPATAPPVPAPAERAPRLDPPAPVPAPIPANPKTKSVFENQTTSTKVPIPRLSFTPRKKSAAKTVPSSRSILTSGPKDIARSAGR